MHARLLEALAGRCLWLVVLAVFFTLMYGNALGLSKVETDRWGGLPLTILLASLSMVDGLSRSRW